MNYNMPINPVNYNQVMDPFFKIQTSELEIQKMKNNIMTLENRIYKLEEQKNNNHFNSNVSNKEDGLYML